MTTATPPAKSPFCSTLSTLQFAWDSTSLGAFKRCPRYYQYSMIENWQSKAPKVALEFGIHYHALLEYFTKILAETGDYETALHKTVRKTLTDTVTYDDAGNCISWETDNKYRNRNTLLRAVVFHCEKFKNDPLKTYILANNKPATELSFKIQLDLTNPDGENYLLCGHMDKVVEYHAELFVLDYKTTATALGDHYFAQYNPDNQISLYTFASSIVLGRPVSGVVIDAAQLLVGSTRHQRSLVFRTQDQLEEWLQDTYYYIKQAEKMAEENYWPMNDSSCMKYGKCPYHEVCSKPSCVRENILQANFEKKVWNPLEER